MLARSVMSAPSPIDLARSRRCRCRPRRYPCRPSSAIVAGGRDRALRASRSTATTVAPSLTSRASQRAPDAAARADDDDDLPVELLLGRHALELRLFEQPVLDVERLLPVSAVYRHASAPRITSIAQL